MATVPPAVTGAAAHSAKVVAVVTAQGAKLIALLVVPRAVIFCATTVMTPVALVVTLATYFVLADAVSQPQLLAVGNIVEDCTTSVIDVRQEEAASITSLTFALTV